MTSRKRLFISLGVLVAVYWIGVIGYVVIGRLTGEQVSFFQAFYMVAITIPTVGYRDELVPRTPLFEAWTIFVILFGVTAAAVAVSSVTGLFVEGEVGRLIGSRKLESRIRHLSNHVVICGFGRMGRLLAERLSERRVPIVVIEREQPKGRRLEELGLLYIVGDATEEEVLERAGIARASHLVAVLTSDADNVFVTLTARQMRPDLYIIARAEQLTSEPKIRRAGANRVLSTQAIGAERIANVITRPQLVDFVDVAAESLELEVDEFVVHPGSPLAGKSLRESNIRQTADVMVVAVKRPSGQIVFNPGATVVVDEGDRLVTIGPSGAVSRLREREIIRDTAAHERSEPSAS
jgi:voltage-gated potassium channel